MRAALSEGPRPRLDRYVRRPPAVLDISVPTWFGHCVWLFRPRRLLDHDPSFVACAHRLGDTTDWLQALLMAVSAFAKIRLGREAKPSAMAAIAAASSLSRRCNPLLCQVYDMPDIA